MEKLEICGVKCIIKYPKLFDQNEKYPVLFFLHGSGSRGDDINKLIDNPFFKLTEKHEDLPFVVVAPLCSENTWFDIFQTLKEIVREVTEYSFADKERIYLMGASMGGYAVWQLAMSMPQYFAAIVPICGGGLYWNAKRLADIPVWAFHGQNDKTVFLEESKKMVDFVNYFGGKAKLTVYKDKGHDAWSDTYLNKEVFDWLLKQKRK